MAEKRRHRLALRAIVVSTRAALRSSNDVERIREETARLLASLEERVIGDGADEKTLREIEEARRELSE